jgi:hypothetical protein
VIAAREELLRKEQTSHRQRVAGKSKIGIAVDDAESRSLG